MTELLDKFGFSYLYLYPNDKWLDYRDNVFRRYKGHKNFVGIIIRRPFGRIWDNYFDA